MYNFLFIFMHVVLFSYSYGAPSGGHLGRRSFTTLMNFRLSFYVIYSHFYSSLICNQSLFFFQLKLFWAFSLAPSNDWKLLRVKFSKLKPEKPWSAKYLHGTHATLLYACEIERKWNEKFLNCSIKECDFSDNLTRNVVYIYIIEF